MQQKVKYYDKRHSPKISRKKKTLITSACVSTVFIAIINSHIQPLLNVGIRSRSSKSFRSHLDDRF